MYGYDIERDSLPLGKHESRERDNRAPIHNGVQSRQKAVCMMLVRNGKNWNDSYNVDATFLSGGGTVVSVSKEYSGRVIYARTCDSPKIAAEILLSLADDIKHGYILNIIECGTNEVCPGDGGTTTDLWLDDIIPDIDDKIISGEVREFVSDYAHEYLDSSWENERIFCEYFGECAL